MKTKDLKPGDVLLCPPIAMPEGWIGQAIVLLTGGKVSHAALYCGERNKELQVAHSDLRGIIYMPLQLFIDEEPGFYVARHREQRDLNPVLQAASAYADKGIRYPVSDFAVLGLIILANRFSSNTLKSKIFYNFALLVCLKIIKEINARMYSEESKTCSQFASQCFTDAGTEYDIKFEKLLLQFGELNNLNGETSLLDLLDSDESIDSLETTFDEDFILNRENEIAQDFIGLIQNETQNSSQESVDKKDLTKIGQKLLLALCKALTKKEPSSVKEAFEILSSNRNYFVLPDDLLSNTKNLEVIGYFNKT